MTQRQSVRLRSGDHGGDYDVIGNAVNTAARLPARPISLSAETFRCLDQATRTGFKKHSAPMVYVPTSDARPG